MQVCQRRLRQTEQLNDFASTLLYTWKDLFLFCVIHSVCYMRDTHH